jgi:hypothetical protein
MASGRKKIDEFPVVQNQIPKIREVTEFQIELIHREVWQIFESRN